ncbi:MAG: outer membrane beta-barrel protein [Mangrovibacterium sp.]
MKRIAFVLLTILIINQTATAQNERSMALSLSFNPTLNWLSVGGSDAEKSKTGMGFDYGINADFFIDHNDKYAVTTGIIISNLNTKVAYNPNHDFSIGGIDYTANTELEVDYRLKYLEVPIAFRLRSKQFDRTTLWGQFGLFTAWNVDARASTSDEQLEKNNINKDVRIFNMGLNIGIGGEYDLGENNAIRLGLVYKNGFLETIKTNLGDKTTTKTLALQMSFVF